MSRRRTARRCLTFSVAAAVSLCSLVACSEQTTPRASTTAIGSSTLQSFGGLGADAQGRRCTGQALVTKLGDASARDTSRESSFAALSGKERDAVVAALNECVSPEGTMGLISTALDLTGSSDPSMTCLWKKFDGKVGNVALGMSDPTQDPTFVTAVDACVPVTMLGAALARLESQQPNAAAASDDPGRLAGCLSNQLTGKVGATFQRMVTSTGEVREIAAPAFAACGVPS